MKTNQKKKSISNPNPFRMVDAKLNLTFCLHVYISLLAVASCKREFRFSSDILFCFIFFVIISILHGSGQLDSCFSICEQVTAKGSMEPFHIMHWDRVYMVGIRLLFLNGLLVSGQLICFYPSMRLASCFSYTEMWRCVEKQGRRHLRTGLEIHR